MPRVKIDPSKRSYGPPEEEELRWQKRGMPPWEPEDWQRELVQKLAGIGLPEMQIAKIIGVHHTTLRAHVKHEMELGIAQTNAIYLNTLFWHITQNKSERMLEFYLRTRLHWVAPKEPGVETDEDVSGMSDEQLRAELDALNAREAIALKARGLAPPV